MLKYIYPNVYIIYDAIGASAEKYLLSDKPYKDKIKKYNAQLKKQIDQVHLANKVIVVSNKLKQYLLETSHYNWLCMYLCMYVCM